jgi:hypothetical protein
VAQESTRLLCLSAIGNRVPLNRWKLVSIRPFETTPVTDQSMMTFLQTTEKQSRKLRPVSGAPLRWNALRVAGQML